MTLRELVLCASPLPTGNTVRTHLQAMTCDFIGGDMTVNGEFIYLKEEKNIVLYDNENNNLQINDEVEVLELEETIINIEEGDII